VQPSFNVPFTDRPVDCLVALNWRLHSNLGGLRCRILGQLLSVFLSKLHPSGLWLVRKLDCSTCQLTSRSTFQCVSVDRLVVGFGLVARTHFFDTVIPPSEV
jgi:hypothetical protein